MIGIIIIILNHGQYSIFPLFKFQILDQDEKIKQTCLNI